MLNSVILVDMNHQGPVFWVCRSSAGSGKTYTMLGDEAMPGVMPRAIRDLFAFAEQEDDWTWRFSMT